MSYERGCDPSQDPERLAPFSASSRPRMSPEEEERAAEGLPGFVVRDSGRRKEFSTGMQRDVTDGKVKYDLIFDGPMMERYAVHMTKGAEKYQPKNWLKASTPEEMERFKESAIRHFFQWVRGERDEDHAAAVYFNINGFELVRGRIEAEEM